MFQDSNNFARTEGYVSPTLDTAFVCVENGFCQSGFHDSFNESEIDLDFWDNN